MAIEANEALKVLGYDPEAFETIDSFKETVEKDWLKADNAHTSEDVRKRVFGAVNGQLRTALKQTGKELDMEAEWDKMDPIDGVRLIAQELGPKLRQMASDLKKAKDGGASAPEIADLQKKYDAAAARATELEGVLKEKEGEFEAYKGEVTAAESKRWMASRYKEAQKDLPYREMSDFERQGFEAALRENVVLVRNEEGEEIVNDKNGERIRDKKKAHVMLTLEEAVKQFAEGAKMLRDPKAPEPVRKTLPISGGGTTHNGRTKTDVPPRPLRPIAAR